MCLEVEECVRVCPACISYSKQNKSAPMKSVVQETFKPWEKVAVDITGPSEYPLMFKQEYHVFILIMFRF